MACEYNDLIDDIVPSLEPRLAAIFALSCWERQYVTALQFGVPEEWRTQARTTADSWWEWCRGGGAPSRASHFLDETSLLIETCGAGGLANSLAVFYVTVEMVFGAFFAGDYHCGRYSAPQNIDMIEGMEEELGPEVDELVSREVARQEQSLTEIVESDSLHLPGLERTQRLALFVMR